MSSNIDYGTLSKNVTKLNYLGPTSYASRAYEPQTQNNFAFQFLPDENQTKYLTAYYQTRAYDIAFNEKGPQHWIDTQYSNIPLMRKEINERLNQSIQQVGAPTKNMQAIIIDYFNSQIKYAGKPTYSNANITFNTLIGLGAKTILAGWASLVMNDETFEGGWARSSGTWSKKSSIPGQGNEYERTRQWMKENFSKTGYKMDGLLLECARDGTIINQWKYIGMWLSTFTPGSYNMTGSSSASQVTGTITVDRIIQEDLSFRERGVAEGSTLI